MSQITLGAVVLPPDMQWTDELAFVPLGGTATTSLSGARIVQAGVMQAGQPITLQGGQDYAWISYATAKALLTLAASPLATYNLTLADGRSYTVRFRVEDTPVEAAPVLHRVSEDAGIRDTLQYIPTLRLETV